MSLCEMSLTGILQEIVDSPRPSFALTRSLIAVKSPSMAPERAWRYAG